MDLARMRNIGIVAHIDAGKTTVSERILFDAGVEHRLGEVDEGTTVLDWMAEERERGITITAAATTVPWKGHAITLIDTPGHVDFTVEVERCMRVLDGALLVLDAVMGVQAQSETVWRQIRRNRVPYLAFANKLDRAGADYLRTVADLRRRLGVPALPLQYPLFEAGNLCAVVDLVSGRTWNYRGAAPSEASALELPDASKDEIGVLRAELFDVLSLEDEDVLAALIEERIPDEAVLTRALRRRVLAGSLVPVLCGSALRNVGIEPLLDAVVAWLPSPVDLPVVVGTDPRTQERIECAPRADAHLCALAFKLQMQTHGDLTFVRIYSGTLAPGAHVHNPRTRKNERIARVLRMHAEAGVALTSAGPGEIVALTGLKWTATGDTVCDKDTPIVLESLDFPLPVIALVIEPASSGDREKLEAALRRLAHEDPTFHVGEDPETGQWTISGMGELHLEVLQHRLAHDFHVAARVGKPRVAYREAVTAAARGHGHVERVIAGKEVFGDVELELVPLADQASARIEWAAQCPIPQAFRASIEETLRSDLTSGPRFGFPLIELAITITGGASDARRDGEVGFTQAANMALRAALQGASVAVLEPLMSFEISAPAEFASGIIADLNSRRAEMTDVQSDGALRSIAGQVPLSRMFGYSTSVRSLSQGRASFAMIPAGFRRVAEEDLVARGLVWV